MEKGAASPGRWQVWQCFCKIGATSLVNVGGGLLGSCPSANPAQHSVPASRMDKYFMNFPTSREQTQSDVRLPRKHTQVDLRIPFPTTGLLARFQDSYLQRARRASKYAVGSRI